MNQNPHSSSSKKTLFSKLKGIFVYEDESGFKDEIVDNFQNNKPNLEELQHEYDLIFQDIEKALQGKIEDFTPQFDIPRLQELQDQIKNIEEAHLREDNFWNKLRQQILQLVPILILLLKDSNPLKQKLLDIQMEANSEDHNNFSDKIQNLMEDLQTQQFDKSKLDSLLAFQNKYTQQQEETEELLNSTLNSYKEQILSLNSTVDNLSIHIKTPEEYEKHAFQIISKYNGRNVGKSDTPSSDAFQADLLREKLQHYRTWYSEHFPQIEKSIAQLHSYISGLINDYNTLVAQESHYLFNKQQQHWNNLSAKLSIPLGKKERNLYLINAFKDFQQTSSTIEKVEKKNKNIQEDFNSFGLINFPLAGQGILEKNSNIFLQEKNTLQEIQTKIVDTLKVNYLEYFKQFTQSSHRNHISKLEEIENEYSSTLEKLNLIAKEYNNLLSQTPLKSKNSISNIKMLNSKTSSKPENYSLSEVKNILNNFSQSLNLPAIHLGEGMNESIHQEEYDDIQERILEELFNILIISDYKNNLNKKILTLKGTRSLHDHCYINIKYQKENLPNFENIILECLPTLEHQCKLEAWDYFQDIFKMEGYQKTEEIQWRSQVRKIIRDVIYTDEYIQIGNVKYATTNLKISDINISEKTENNLINCVQEGEEINFNWVTIKQLCEENKIKLPSVNDIKNTLKLLPEWPKSMNLPSPHYNHLNFTFQCNLLKILLKLKENLPNDGKSEFEDDLIKGGIRCEGGGSFTWGRSGGHFNLETWKAKHSSPQDILPVRCIVE